MTASTGSMDAQTLAPTVSKVTIFPPMYTVPTVPADTMVVKGRTPRDEQYKTYALDLKRSLTFGVLGDDR